jgi:chemotaxis protein methyltransferase CheR
VDEVTHRALNDFAIMSALVRRAGTKVADSAARQAIDDVLHHLHIVASTLRVLKPPRDNAMRSLNRDVEELCGALSTAIASERPVRLTLMSEPIVLSATDSWRICLIIAELVMNAARHAFRSVNGGEIIVDLSMHDGTLRCAVLDNGCAGAVIASGRGSAILDAIATELSGIIGRTHTARGLAIILHVPISAPSNDG